MAEIEENVFCMRLDAVVLTVGAQFSESKSFQVPDGVRQQIKMYPLHKN